ncbi:hypothetical protein F4810DRAFT_653822 [Camillea tinctor]|nr:hypothetical protein F4810DRAFT_653822 [Camillea tinctor]
MASSLGLAATRQLVATARAVSSGRTAIVRNFAGFGFVRTYAAAAATTKRTAASAAKKTSASAKKPAAKKTTAAAKKTSATKAKAKAGTKTKTVKAKAKPTTAATKKKKAAPTEEVLLKRQRLELKKAGLFTEPKQLAENPWPVFVTEKTTGKSISLEDNKSRMNLLSAEYKALSPSQKQHYEQQAEKNKATNAANYKAWVNSLSVDEVRTANNARKLLKSKFQYPTKQLKLIHDDRQPKRPLTAFILFTKEKWNSGAVDPSKPLLETTRGIADEWKSLSPEARKPYLDLAVSDLQRYEKDIGQLGWTMRAPQKERASARA